MKEYFNLNDQWDPDIVIASGPPMYLPLLSFEQKEIAQYNAEMLVKQLIHSYWTTMYYAL